MARSHNTLMCVSHYVLLMTYYLLFILYLFYALDMIIKSKFERFYYSGSKLVIKQWGQLAILSLASQGCRRTPGTLVCEGFKGEESLDY